LLAILLDSPSTPEGVESDTAYLASMDNHATHATPCGTPDEDTFDILPDHDIKDEKASVASHASPLQTKFVNGEPIIVTGEDISNYIVDDRDDEDPAITFRSFVLGTIIAGLGAALSQVEALTLRF
jgi:hypothetical protein